MTEPSARRVRASSLREDCIFAVAGYKSIRDEVQVRIRPLTLIAGTNSSGKSSFMQPFLMLKQTAEAQFDPGPLLIHGPNVQLTSWTQGLSRGKSKNDLVSRFSIRIEIGPDSIQNIYSWTPSGGLSIAETKYSIDGDIYRLRASSTSKEIVANIPSGYSDIIQDRSAAFRIISKADEQPPLKPRFSIRRGKCFLELDVRVGDGDYRQVVISRDGISKTSFEFLRFFRNVIHVPGLRGNPERTYTSSAAGRTYPGTMDIYVASVIHSWATSNTGATKLDGLAADLRHLGLTWKIRAQRIDDVRLELLVGRMPTAQSGGANDLVNIADVGFGVSQVLPILVALHAAARGQLVYVEQPETHLHPRAQTRLGDVLVAAANRGVRVVVETHSSLLLRAIQTSIARGRIASDRVSLNWFSREATTGYSKVETAELDSLGRFGGWPVDFDDVADQADWEFLNAVQEAGEDAE